MNTRMAGTAAAAAVALTVVACGGGGSDAPAPVAMGTLQVALTDAPACGFDEIVVTVRRVRAHRSAAAGDGDAGWTDIDVDPPRQVNLLDLQNGELQDLGQTTLAAGAYTQLRLLLAANSGNAPANYVVPSGGDGTPQPVALDTPSAQQSGIKLIHGFTIEPGRTTRLVLDFDACKSVVQRGNRSYGLKPVIGVMPMSLTRIVGYVEAGTSGVAVSAQKGGVIHRATQPDGNGRFVLGPIDPAQGPYDLVFAGAGRTTSVVAGVPVVQDQTTTINTSTSAVSVPPAMTSSIVSGQVNPMGARATGWVRALQTVGPVAGVEVAYRNVLGSDGTYSMALPTVAPRHVAFAVPFVTPPAFASDPDNTGKYRLEAGATGYATQTKTPPTLAGVTPLPGQDFTLVAAP